MLELDGGIQRVTFALPLGIDHVHCYFLPASTRAWVFPMPANDGRRRWTGSTGRSAGS
jgi:hypothetical protein